MNQFSLLSEGTFQGQVLVASYPYYDYRRHCRCYCWTKPALLSLSLARALPPFSPRDTLAPASPFSPPTPSFFLVCFLLPTTVSTPLSSSSLFYLNLPQICSPTKQLPSLFWAIICGSMAREADNHRVIECLRAIVECVPADPSPAA